jgi:membrane protein
MPRVVTATWTLLRESVTDWWADDAPQLAAGLSYYALFSLTPLLVIVISVAGIFYGQEAVRGDLVAQIDGLVGRDGARAIEDLIATANQQTESLLAAAIGLVFLLLGAGGVLLQLQRALNAIWEVEAPPSSGVWSMVRIRLMSFVFVLTIGFLLLVSLTINAVLVAVQQYATTLIPGSESVWMLVNTVASVAIITVLFALMFKYVPDAVIAWSDVWVGALFTAILFTVGKSLLGWYLGRASFISAYGAAGSLVVVLVWIYYSAQILFLGAEMTQVYARMHGSRIRSRFETAAQRDAYRDQESSPAGRVSAPNARRM